MNEFSLWFWRPIGEFTGVLFAMGALVAVGMALLFATSGLYWCKTKWRNRHK